MQGAKMMFAATELQRQVYQQGRSMEVSYAIVIISSKILIDFIFFSCFFSDFLCAN